MIILPFLAKAQEEAADTVATLAAQELHEVVVAASPVVHKVDMDVYRPSASAVANAKDGVQLLNNLMIPEIVRHTHLSREYLPDPGYNTTLNLFVNNIEKVRAVSELDL